MMSKRDNLQVIVELAVDHKEGEPSKWKTANTPDGADPLNDAPRRRIVRNEPNDVLNLNPQTVAKSRAFRFVPPKVIANL